MLQPPELLRDMKIKVTKLAAFVSTPKSLPRQLRPPHISAHNRLSVGSAFSVPSSSSQEEKGSMYLPEGANEREEPFTPLLQPVDCKWEALSGESMEEFIIRADEVVSYVLNTIAPSQKEQLWEGVVKRHCSVPLSTKLTTLQSMWESKQFCRLTMNVQIS